MITCTRRLEFDAAHRLVNHEGKCKMLHGHRYVVEASFVVKNSNQNQSIQGFNLDEVGRVVDFGLVKEILGSWIDENLDHNTILNIADEELGRRVAAITGQKIYYLNCNPTAENIAAHLLEEICPRLFAGQAFRCCAIKIFETPNCSAEIRE